MLNTDVEDGSERRLLVSLLHELSDRVAIGNISALIAKKSKHSRRGGGVIRH